MTNNSEVEASRFARSVEEIEKLIRSGGQPGSGYSLAALLDQAQTRLDSIRAEDDHVTADKKDKDQKERSAIAQMVEREAKLNEEEKRKYAEFLAKDYFTKSDFADLSRFYADGGAYDRLSEGGKAEMNERVKEGIKRGEFSREDLPKAMEEKALGDEVPPQSKVQDAPSKPSAETSATSGDQFKSVARREAEIESPKSSDEMSTLEQEEKSSAPEGLEGLAKLSPVQDTDEVTVPQAGVGGGSRQIGG